MAGSWLGNTAGTITLGGDWVGIDRVRIDPSRLSNPLHSYGASAV